MTAERHLTACQRWRELGSSRSYVDVRDWVRVFGLTYFYFPFWRNVNAFRRAYRAAFVSGINLVTTEELWKLTEPLDEHPDGWEHPCMCASCRSYADG